MEKYAESMILKYSIALAFAVLRIKPSDVDGKQFTLHLQEKLRNTTKILTETNTDVDVSQLQNSQTLEELTQIFDQTFDSTSIIEDSQLTENKLGKSDLVNNFSVFQAIRYVKEFLESGHGDFQYWAPKQRKLSESLESQESGYRTSSQHSRFRDVVERKQVSESNLNISATTITSFITESTKSCSSEPLLEHAAQLLGQLVDRMHLLEEYPSFIEDILDIVSGLLDEIWSCGKDLDIDKKEIVITKLMLMNKSIHVRKYSILQLLTRLNETHNEIMSSETMYELDNTDRIDALFYAYYALDHLIAEYVKGSDIKTQDDSRQDSQTTNSDDPSQSQQYSTTRSSIEDIWRRKWDPNFDNEKERRKRESKKEEKSIKKECKDTLNKIVIDCMEKYPLISFYALECYNKVVAKNA